MRVLLVKTSSLGDVIHNLPVVADIHYHYADAKIDWVVEENFAAIPGLNSNVDRVFPVAMRRWRKHLSFRATWEEWRAFKKQLQPHSYDFVIDTQGLIKSAVIARAARGLRCGYDWDSAREPLASFAYQRKFNVAKNLHAVERNRQLAAKALGYEASPEPSYGLSALGAASDNALPTPYVVCLRATSRAEKEWPQENWIALGKRFAARGFANVFPSGNEHEYARAREVAGAISNARALPPGSLDDVAAILSNATAVIGVDTGLTHLACALGKPTVALFCNSDSRLTGVYGSACAVNLGGIGAPPSVEAVVDAYERIRNP
ncbi:MAG: lipopolysaccharide heptosyltransferase I [Pseudomonadota bacterium]|nr:lipopolysaccharide heptosyltransferase I [Pseudomonadota bacterium]